MSWQSALNRDPLPWLLESESPGVRYLALRDLLGRSEDDPELVAARQAAHVEGPIAQVLAAMDEAGYWVEPGSGYAPKYRGTVWSILSLAQMGARADIDERIGRACAYLLDQALAPGGQFGIYSRPSSTADCLQGNLCWALPALGYDDPRLESTFEWMAQTTTGEGLTPASERSAPRRYYAGKCGPLFEWHRGGHTNSLVPLFARGDAAGVFATEVVALDPVRGGYVDNTAIARVVAAAMAPAATEHRAYCPLLSH